MKKAIVLCMAIMVMAMAVQAFDAPGGALYGVTADGTYFVSADLVKAANGSAPKAMVAPSFKREAMVLDGNYYVYKSGKSVRAKTDFCFDIGNNQYIPHAVIDDARVKAADVSDNGVGGFNFRVAPK